VPALLALGPSGPRCRDRALVGAAVRATSADEDEAAYRVDDGRESEDSDDGSDDHNDDDEDEDEDDEDWDEDEDEDEDEDDATERW